MMSRESARHERTRDANRSSERAGETGLPTYARPAASQTRSARGAPSQQLAFMWQCGHSQRVETGSNGFPQ